MKINWNNVFAFVEGFCEGGGCSTYYSNKAAKKRAKATKKAKKRNSRKAAACTIALATNRTIKNIMNNS